MEGCPLAIPLIPIELSSSQIGGLLASSASTRYVPLPKYVPPGNSLLAQPAFLSKEILPFSRAFI